MLKKGQSNEEEVKAVGFAGRLLVTLKSSIIKSLWMTACSRENYNEQLHTPLGL